MIHVASHLQFWASLHVLVRATWASIVQAHRHTVHQWILAFSHESWCSFFQLSQVLRTSFIHPHPMQNSCISKSCMFDSSFYIATSVALLSWTDLPQPEGILGRRDTCVYHSCRTSICKYGRLDWAESHASWKLPARTIFLIWTFVEKCKYFYHYWELFSSTRFNWIESWKSAHWALCYIGNFRQLKVWRWM